MGRIFVLVILFVLMIEPAFAKRVLYLPPILSQKSFGGYNTEGGLKHYCELGYSFFESMQKSEDKYDRRGTGVWVGLAINLRNLSTETQTIKLVFEGIQYETCYVANPAFQWPTCFKKFYNNGGPGYSVNFTLAGNENLNTRWQIGCSGDATTNMCWLTMFESKKGSTVLPLNFVFGTPSLFDNTPYDKKLCYTLSSTLTTRVEVTEDKGAMSGAVNVEFSTKGDSGSSFQMNGGRPF